MESKKSNIINFFTVVARQRRLIIVNFLIVCSLTAVYSLLMPKTFTARATILAPQDESEFLGLSSLINNLPIGKLGLGMVSEETYMFTAILNSRTVMEAIAKKFNLQELYKTKNLEETVKELREQVSVEINEDLTISVAVSSATGFLASEEDENVIRKRAADMTNAFLEELDQVNKQLKTEKARNNRIFIEKRYQQNMDDLKKAEVALKDFQETHGLIALPEQTEASIKAAAELKAQATVKEIEVAVLSKYVSGSHVELVRAKNELRELNRKLDEMNTGTNEGLDVQNGKSDAKLFVPFNQAPELGLQYVRLYREVTLEQKIMEFLLPQYELAKIQEAKDTPTVQVLDEAVMPIKRTKPKRTIMVLAAGLLSIFFSVVAILLQEYVRTLESTRSEDYQKLREIVQSVRGDIRKIFGRKS